MSLHLNSATLSLDVQLPEHIFTRHLPASPVVVGEALTEQVMAYVQSQRLGYFPALAYFRALPAALEPELLDAAENIAWFTCNQARGEIQRKLRPVFSSLSVQSAQALAFTMPAVRPHQGDRILVATSPGQTVEQILHAGGRGPAVGEAVADEQHLVLGRDLPDRQ